MHSFHNSDIHNNNMQTQSFHKRYASYSVTGNTVRIISLNSPNFLGATRNTHEAVLHQNAFEERLFYHHKIGTILLKNKLPLG